MTPLQRNAVITALAAAIATPAEGLRRIAYYDPPGILTVCRGHTGPDIVPGKRYSLAECDQFMTDDMRKAVAIVGRCHPGMPVEIAAAFADAVFNLGPAIVCDKSKSTAARNLYAKDYAAACNQLPRWDKAKVLGVMIALPGLTKRRGEEMALCLRGVA